MNKIRLHAMRGIMSVMLLLLLVLGSVFYTTEANNGGNDPWTGAWAKGAHIPVIINLYPNCNVTETEARAYIEQANDILKQANIHLRPVHTNTEATIKALVGKGGDAGGDGRFREDEHKDICDFGEEEINRFTPHTDMKEGNKKGVKISFGKEIQYRHNSVLTWSAFGLAWPCTYRTMLVRKSSAAEAAGFGRNVTRDTGVTIAHELGHILTIKDHSTGADHLMSANASGEKLTKEQIDEIWKRVKVIGKCSIQWAKYEAAIKAKHQHGTTTDDRGDVTPTGNPISDVVDLTLVFLTSLDEASNIDAQMIVAGVLPDDEDLTLTYSLGIDTDDNIATGAVYAGTSGIDRIVYVYATGNIGLGTFVLSGQVKNTHNDEVMPLPYPPVSETAHKVTDRNDSSEAVGTSVFLSVPKLLLGQLAAEVPVVATAGVNSAILDTASFEFDMLRWLKDPTFTTFGTGVPTPSEDYPFEISGLKANDSFNLYLDDTLILSNTLDANGGFSGSFVFPSDLPNDVIYFLTAQDSTGEFAYSITCPREEAVGGLGIARSRFAVLASWIVLLSVLVTGGVILVRRQLRIVRS